MLYRPSPFVVSCGQWRGKRETMEDEPKPRPWWFAPLVIGGMVGAVVLMAAAMHWTS